MNHHNLAPRSKVRILHQDPVGREVGNVSNEGSTLIAPLSLLVFLM